MFLGILYKLSMIFVKHWNVIQHNLLKVLVERFIVVECAICNFCC